MRRTAVESDGLWRPRTPGSMVSARKTRVYDRKGLRYGHVIKGPAIIGEYSATTLVPPDFVCEVDAFGNLVLKQAR